MGWAESQIKLGMPRQEICQGWLDQDRCTLTPEERVVYQQAERQLFAQMVARDLRGVELEKRGLRTEAIALYEANVSDRFLGAHTYQRLQALYLAQGDYDKALRISRIHVALLSRTRLPVPSWNETVETKEASETEEFDADALTAPSVPLLRLVDI
jgi:tetratricopeptide (TPR) repeat protein